MLYRKSENSSLRGLSYLHIYCYSIYILKVGTYKVLENKIKIKVINTKMKRKHIIVTHIGNRIWIKEKRGFFHMPTSSSNSLSWIVWRTKYKWQDQETKDERHRSWNICFVLFLRFFNGKTEGRQWTLNNSDKRNDPLRVNNLQLVVLIGSKELYKITTVNVVLSSVHGEKVMAGGLPSRLPKPVLLPLVSRRGWSFENASYFSKSLTAQIRKFILAFKNKEKWTHTQAHIHEASCRLQLDGGEKTDHCPILFSMNKRESIPSHIFQSISRIKQRHVMGSLTWDIG